MKPRAETPGEAILGLAALILFVVYFGVHCFRYPRVGDHLRHTASVASLYRDFLHPAHEAMPFPGTLSEVHTPYIVAVAGVGRLLGVTPYRALQLFGVANLVFYCWAVWFFFRTFSVVRSNWVGIVAFLLVSLFLRNRIFWWASETSFAAVRLIQSYPSFFAWGAALTCFALAHRFLRRPRVASFAWIVALVWTLVLSHNLTASWVVGILGLQGFFALVGGGERRRSVPFLAGGVAVAVALAFAWPYFDIRRSPGLLGIAEGSEFGAHPFRDMAGLYALALAAALFFLSRRRHSFWVAGFVVTFLALTAFRALGVEYGNRYAFFQAFFAQVLVAEFVGVGAVLLFRREDRLGEGLAIGPRLRVGILLFGAATLVLTATAPVAREERRAGRPLLTLRELAAAPATHDQFYASLGEVGRLLGPDDVVLMPVEHAAWNVASITGARVVVSLFAYRVPDYPARVRDVGRFFGRDAASTERVAILRRYGVTKVLLTASVTEREEELTPLLGDAIARAPNFVLFRTTALPGQQTVRGESEAPFFGELDRIQPKARKMKKHSEIFRSPEINIMGNVGKWDPWYRSVTKEEPYSDVRTYELGAAYLKDCDPIEDWGCGRGWFRRYMARQRYRGIDASKTPFADVIADLARYRSRVEGIFIRHVLEHDWEWERILRNAVASFTKKLVVVIFTPFSQDGTKEIAYAFDMGVPDISFRYEDIVRNFEGLEWRAETLETDTQYGTETVFYVKKPPLSSA